MIDIHEIYARAEGRAEKIRTIHTNLLLREMEIEHLRRVQKGIEHGYVEQGLVGSNERQREADLAKKLSKDKQYRDAERKVEEAKKLFAENTCDLEYQRNLIDLEKAALAASYG